MGSAPSEFQTEEGKEKLKEYQELTYLTKEEILKCFKAFKTVAGEPKENFENWIIDEDEFKNFDQFKNNPFIDRIFEIFSNNDGKMSFEHYLDMMSVFSDSCPTDLKAKYAFKIYDFKNCDYFDRDDINTFIERITEGKFSQDERNMIIDKIFEEADIDGNNQIKFEEFNHIANKYSQDFHKTFSIKI